uniref:Uncharacterized protein n=2 Tax=Palpitomonas bilix TaxID=652834 RepID=A0A7S3DIK6_9EUKA|mmetsp:Transcript_38694/g.99349  ORF Transcript_38694/g.99349 Transcript_38694/m.99349 type:complete len:495 (+) Transcript_38694:112-1596(+)
MRPLFSRRGHWPLIVLFALALELTLVLFTSFGWLPQFQPSKKSLNRIGLTSLGQNNTIEKSFSSSIESSSDLPGIVVSQLELRGRAAESLASQSPDSTSAPVSEGSKDGQGDGQLSLRSQIQAQPVFQDFISNMTLVSRSGRRVVNRGDIQKSWKEDDISVSVHLSVDRLSRLQLLMLSWDGPVNAAIFVSDPSLLSELEKFASKGVQSHKSQIQFLFCIAKTSRVKYPANILRNLALHLTTTSMVFMLDIDLIPNKGMYQYLKERRQSHLVALTGTSFNSSSLLPRSERKKSVFTTVAWEHTRKALDRLSGLNDASATTKVWEELFPQNATSVKNMKKEGLLRPILFEEFFEGFSCVDFDRWERTIEDEVASPSEDSSISSGPYEIKYQWPCEPYVIAATEDVPDFDERFLYYGNDKAQFLLGLHYEGYSFRVIPAHFLVHVPHREGEWKQQERGENSLKIAVLTERFKFESGTKSGVNWRVRIPFFVLRNEQ